MKALPLFGSRAGRRVLRWPVLLARCAVYFVIFGAATYGVTWLSDSILHQEDRKDWIRLVVFGVFFAVVFVLSDARKDASLPLDSLPDLDRHEPAPPK